MRSSISVCWLWLACSGGHEPAPGPSRPAEPPPTAPVVEAPTPTPATPTEPAAPSPAADPLPAPAPHLALGGTYGCFSDATGAVRCFGANHFGQRGAAPSARAQPASTPLGSARRVVVGIWHTCLLEDDGALRCLGHGGRGQLGDGAREDRASPVTVIEGDAPIVGVVDACAGEGHTCARHADRHVSCWGANDRGQLGDGTFEDRLAPVRVAIDDVVELACGRAHTCARRADGSVHCWGENVDGQLGDGTRSEPDGRRATPARVDVSADRLFAGPGATCVIHETRAVCWGRNDSFQLAVAPGGEQSDALLAPTPIPGAERVAEVAIGARHTCVRDLEGAVRCVGANRLGQLGDGTRQARRGFVPVALGSPAYTIAAGVDHTCALVDASGAARAFCWGADREGQLGRRTRGRDRWSTTPVAVE
jgi:alpha-tubulin suppressor-like RCC1 family protein